MNKKKNCTNNPNVGINEIANNILDVSVYPNPFDNELNIILTDNIENTTISIINTVGKIVLTTQAKSYTNMVDLSNLPIGMYFVRVSSQEGLYTQKIIKK